LFYPVSTHSILLPEWGALISTQNKEFKRGLGRDASKTKVFGGVLSVPRKNQNIISFGME